MNAVCEPSVVTEDWITKGVHIHVMGVELNIFTTHRESEFDFRAVFSRDRAKRRKGVNVLDAALRHVREKCLPNPKVRKRWISRLEMARQYMIDYRGEHDSLANGKMYDFKLIRIALERWGERNGNS
jgi:hypothetical protein